MKKHKKELDDKPKSLKTAFINSCKLVGLTTPSELNVNKKEEWEKVKNALVIPDFFFDLLVNQFEDERLKGNKKIISIFDSYSEPFGYALINIDDLSDSGASTITIAVVNKGNHIIWSLSTIQSEMLNLFGKPCVIRCLNIGNNRDKKTIEKYRGYKSDILLAFDSISIFGEIGGKPVRSHVRNWAIENTDNPNTKNGLIDLRSYYDIIRNKEVSKLNYRGVNFIMNEFYMKDTIPETGEYSSNYVYCDPDNKNNYYGYDKYGYVIPATKYDILDYSSGFIKFFKELFGDKLLYYSKEELMDRFSFYLCIPKPILENNCINEKYDPEMDRNRLYLIKNDTSFVLDALLKTSL